MNAVVSNPFAMLGAAQLTLLIKCEADPPRPRDFRPCVSTSGSAWSSRTRNRRVIGSGKPGSPGVLALENTSNSGSRCSA